jgi:hydrogenase maturation factor HypE
MQKHFVLIAILLAMLLTTGCTTNNKTKSSQVIEPIQVDVPLRPEGQKDVLELRTPKIDTVRVGFIGLGSRGPGAVQRYVHIPGAKIVRTDAQEMLFFV